MSQHDMDVANGSGSTVRSDINSALQALASTSKGNSRPSTVYSGQLWLDDNSPSSTVWTLYLYDGVGDIALGTFDTTADLFSPYGGQQLLQTSTASTSATLDFTSLIASSYKSYLIEISNLLLATNGADLWLRTSTNNGVSFASTNEYNHSRVGNAASSTTPAGGGGSADTKIVVASGLLNTKGCSGWMRVDASLNVVSWDLIYSDSSSLIWQTHGGGRVETSAINAMRLMASSGNLTSGTVRFYGIR